MNYFKLEMTTEWCGMDSQIGIKSTLSKDELEDKHGEYFDELARENTLSFTSEEEINEEGYELEEASHWYLEEIKLEDFLEMIGCDETIEALE